MEHVVTRTIFSTSPVQPKQGLALCTSNFSVEKSKTKGLLLSVHRLFHSPRTAFPRVTASARKPPSRELVYNRPASETIVQAVAKKTVSGQILLFPALADEDSTLQVPARNEAEARTAIVPEVVVSGSFRKDLGGLRRVFQQLKDLGCRILSPQNTDPTREVDGFVYMRGEESETPEVIQLRHLDAIQGADFVWLHAPDGYVGTSAALEVGFANAIGVPVFSVNPVTDPILNQFVRAAVSPEAVLNDFWTSQLPTPTPALLSFQRYYRRVASQRGYERESARDCLLLMVEEVGELARAVRKRKKLKRYGTLITSTEAQELADVFLYVIHLANILDLNLSKVVREKEDLNLRRFLARS